MNPDQQLIHAVLNGVNDEWINKGIQVGKLYTDHGFPVDMALERFKCSKEAKLAMLHGVCQWLIQHKRNSGATEKSIERQRATNRRMVHDFVKSGETGAY